jgi:hypothetical protein
VHGLALSVRAGQFTRQSAVLQFERSQVGDETVIVLLMWGMGRRRRRRRRRSRRRRRIGKNRERGDRGGEAR